MRRAGGGSILNIAALSMLQPIRGFGLSVASWAGVMGLAKTLSLEPSGTRPHRRNRGSHRVAARRHY
jgi:3-oxoacyl-[acyl-carrier protein] reductase